ncbi:hypothetical protein ACFL4E_03115 [Candidatus Omnitrophota bacterium]
MNSRKTIKVVLCAFLLSGWVSGALSAEEESGKKKVKWVKSKTGIKSLMTFAKDRNAMIKEYGRETANYKEIKSAVDNGHLEVGDDAQKIAKRYGDPVVVVPESEGDITRWVYKPGDETYFKGSKVYLFFDQTERLMDWQEVNKSQEK